MVPEAPSDESIKPVLDSLMPQREVILDELRRREREGPINGLE